MRFEAKSRWYLPVMFSRPLRSAALEVTSDRPSGPSSSRSTLSCGCSKGGISEPTYILSYTLYTVYGKKYICL